MGISTTPITTRPWRVEEVSAARFGESTSLFQPGRLDVLVHLLAFEQLAERFDASVELSRPLTKVDWLTRSRSFTTIDNEQGVVEIAAEIVGSPSFELPVSFASGGQLVRGAASAAGAVHAGRVIQRVESVDKVIDRSYAKLRVDGWATDELRTLLHTWTRVDPSAAVVMIDLDASGAEAAEYELSCRYPVMAAEVEHLSTHDARLLGCRAGGSVRVLYISAAGPTFAQVLDRQRDAITLAGSGASARRILENLCSPTRAPSSSPAHEQRLRRERRRERLDQLFRRVLER